ncbi:MAG: alpha-galactosidase [Proteobacteria bacterium]|nr:alpha-galactosidase [Pseudomonadota bacterium]
MPSTLSLSAGPLSLVLGLPDRGMPEILAFGRGAAAPDFWPDVPRSSRINGMDTDVPSAVLLPVAGLGAFGWPAISGHRDGRDFLLDFSGWTTRRDGKTTRLAASDAIAGIDIEISIRMNEAGVFGLSTRLSSVKDGVYTLDRCMAGSFLLPAGAATATRFTGMWGREFQIRRHHLAPGITLQESRRGRTSHDRQPYLGVTVGAARFAFHLGWSGNHLVAVDTLDDGRRLVHLGALFEPGEIRLSRGDSYQSPVVYAAEDAAALQAFVRSDILSWPGGAMSPRPVTLNTWEGNYFDHRLDSLKAQADAAAALGIERFVLDDGWFGRRDDDTTSLGDWIVDHRKYPDGLKPLVDHVTSLGMQFGIWFEPEMVNEDSDLYRAHPDWALKVEGRPLLRSRHQQVLDLTRPEVTDYLFGKIAAVLSSLAVSYIKWDMNRDLTHVGGADGRAVTTAQTRATHALMARVRAAFPHVEIESCSSGGGRTDYGALANTQRVWTSDCTDALDRLEIQRGASLFLPPEIMGAHVSANPSHQSGRTLSLTFRALVAMAYHLGVELNPLVMSAAERTELAGYIALHKRLRPLLHAPSANFNLDPRDGRYVWGAMTAEHAAIFVAQGPTMIAEQPEPLVLRLPGAPERMWRIAATHGDCPSGFIRMSDGQTKLLAGELTFSAAALASAGLPLPMQRPETALLLELRPIA